MIDQKYLRNDTKEVATKLQKKHFTLNVEEYTKLEQQRKEYQKNTEDLLAKRNKGAKLIGQAKAKGESAEEIMQEMQSINNDISKHSEVLDEVKRKLKDIELGIPNIPDEQVPEGKEESNNLVLRHYGEPKKFTFEVKEHANLGIDKIDFSSAIKLSGSRFAILKGKMASLHRALVQFMLDVHINEHGYTEYYVPYLVSPKVLEGGGQLPKFVEDQFHVEKDNLYLIPTSEPALININRERVIDVSELPIKMVAHTPCFRREAGSYGRDTTGMFRQHQFDKVEMVQITEPDKSDEALEGIVKSAESILQKLCLPYRVVDLCGGDLGFGATRTFDIEVWLPGQNTYREISSCSNCRDFQARRMQTRFKDATNTNHLVHTLNGSGLAVGRTLIAVMENYQQEDGSVIVPDVLKPYLNNIEKV